jgi:hypothetical protein
MRQIYPTILESGVAKCYCLPPIQAIFEDIMIFWEMMWLIFESSSKSLFPKSSKKPSASLQPLLLVSKICSAEQLSSSSSSAGRIIKGPQTQSSLSLYRYDRHDHIDIDSNLSVCGPFIMVEVMIFCIRKGVNG